MSDWSFGWLAGSKTYLIDLSRLTGAYKKFQMIFFPLLNTFVRLPWIFHLPDISCCVQTPAVEQTPLLGLLNLDEFRLLREVKYHLSAINKFPEQEQELSLPDVCLCLILLKRPHAHAVLEIIIIPSTAATVAAHAVMWFRPVEVSLG